MELLLFRHDEFDKLYGCDGFNADKIPLEQRTNIVNGGILITLFFIFELSMFINALETGILGIIGAVYCDYSLLIYTTGSMITVLWIAETSAEMMLAIDRCIELLRPQLAHAIFSGCPPLVYLLLNNRIRNDCANFGHAIFRFLRNGNNSVSNGPTAMAWTTPNYARNNANNRNNNNNNVQQQR
ncbi:hypothetical protein niasHT_038386 [Heterodera trifolii]|uniref:Uncharacterized protein n=1 Tax=Heterodera trifolii TaxID=157864 RepID=A0ABD2IRX7_9BILA